MYFPYCSQNAAFRQNSPLENGAVVYVSKSCNLNLRSNLQLQVTVEVDVSKPDLTAALKEIRSQYEVIAIKNQQTSEEWYKSKFANFTENAARGNEAARAAKEEITEYRRQLQSRNIEIEAVKCTNESLEKQMLDMEDRHNAEINNLQVVTKYSAARFTIKTTASHPSGPLLYGPTSMNTSNPIAHPSTLFS